jgi:hypothetical protein
MHARIKPSARASNVSALEHFYGTRLTSGSYYMSIFITGHACKVSLLSNYG